MKCVDIKVDEDALLKGIMNANKCGGCFRGNQHSRRQYLILAKTEAQALKYLESSATFLVASLLLYAYRQ